MGSYVGPKTILQRWLLFKRTDTQEEVLVTEIHSHQDKLEIVDYLFESSDDVLKRLVAGDVIILSPTGFIVESFYEFHRNYVRVKS